MAAIHSKKRDRVNTMNPSSNSTTTTSSARSTSPDQEEEYERAVAFLREFHSRRVVAQATFLHSTSLDDIVEADHFDEMLASDFSLALSVGQQQRRSSSSDDLSSSGSDSGESNNDQQQQHQCTFSRSRMKKTTKSKCLLDLHDSISSSDLEECSSLSSTTTASSGGLQQSSPNLFAACGGGGLLRTVSPTPEPSIDTDYYFGYDDEISLPMTKRHRSSW
eukprot:CAMPEP_0202030208 /NCGR_PEP_ID=MMETSP0905-20130828/64381_1 /ASSEMBLY_ACC=CAM_ASM_000554 /TAXON_ID=420261 /ORGANISM="Thalassiosira antarctica, Strain CCMP982" /LENGTH=219 /DNA_ID=CAMNT_0048594001 /DNA_START=326 /DNA_END=982 /DNA_ORIENTATION=-